MILAIAMAFTNTVAGVFCKSPAGVLALNEVPEVYLRRGIDFRQLSWRLTDWTGNERARGSWPDSRKLELQPLPAGYYWLSVSNATSGACLRDTTFCVMERVPRLPDDSRYAIMTALAYVPRRDLTDCPWLGGDLTKRDAGLLERLGYSCVRELVKWTEIEPEGNVWKGESGRCRNAFGVLKDAGVRRLSFFETAPQWTKVGDSGSKLPRDLKALYDFCRRLANEERDESAAWEFWNEQDLEHRSQEGAWEYAACLKAASLGFKAGDPAKPVLNGPFCLNPTYRYVKAVCANDIAPYIDALSYHTYANLADYDAWMANVRKLTAGMGVSDMAIWLTEHHTNQEGNSTEESVRTGLRQHSRLQELVVTEFTPKALAMMAQLGVARDFYFILSSLNERQGAKDWGLCRRDGTVKPAYCALGTFLSRVGRATLEGEINWGKGVRAFLYRQPNGDQTVLAWSISDLDTGGVVRELKSAVRTVFFPDSSEHVVVDTCGMCRTAKGSLDLTRFPLYVEGFRGLKATTPAVRPGKLGHRAIAADEDPTIVIQVRINRDDFALSEQRAVAEMRSKKGRVRVEIWNFSDIRKHGFLEVTGGALAGVPDAFDVPAGGCAAFDAVFCPSTSVGQLVVSGRFDGRRSTRLLMDYRNLAAALDDAETIDLDVLEPLRWQRNTNADRWNARVVSEERAICFESSWKNGDAWTYPIYWLGAETNHIDEILQVEYEVRMEQDKVENDVSHCFVMVGYGDGRPLYRIKQQPPGGTWERRVAIIPPPPAGEKGPGAHVDRLQFGCGPRGSELRYFIRNARVRYLRKVQSGPNGGWWSRFWGSIFCPNQQAKGKKK